MWAWALDLVVAGLCLGIAIARWAPAEDLPWTPLQLGAPIGLATSVKFERAASDPALCRAVLSDGGVRIVDEPDRNADGCATRNVVRTPGEILAPAATVMTCGEALAYAFWVRQDVQPAARAELGAPITRIEHYGTYACRNVYGRAEGRRSEHAFANALDVAAFRTASGRRITIVGDFRSEDAEGRFLRRARDGACRWFRAVLSPDYNAAHRDHLHLDRGRYRACR